LLVDGLAESTQDLSQGLNEGARPTGRIESNLWDLEVQVSDWIYSFRTSASQEAKPLYRAASQMCFVLREVNLYELDPNADPMKRKEALAIKGNVERMYQSLVEQRYAPLQQQLENPSLVQWQDVVASLRQLAPSIATKAMMQRLDAVELKEVAGPGGQMGRREPVRKVRVNRSAPEDGVEQRRQTRLPTDSSSRSPSKKILRFSDQSDAAEFRVRDASANRPSALGASIRRLQEARLSLPQHDHVQVLEQWKIDQTSFKAEGDEPGLGDRLWNNWENLPHPLTGERGKRSYVNLVLADYYNHRDLGARQHELLRNQLLNRRKLRTDAVVWQVPIQPPLSLMRSASRRELPGSSLEQSSGSELEHSSELLHDTQGSAGPSQPKQIPSVQTQARLTKLAKKFLQGDFMATAKPGTNLRGLQIQVEIIAKFLAKGGEHNEALRTNTEELRGKLSDRLQKLGFAVEARIRHKTDKREEDRRREYETLAASIVDLKAKIRSFDIDIATTTS
jgi:hypothetical protein